ncbi:MAG TPA: glycoside hydrolase family 15 protein, partial [Xanthobacteraceae bacterium]|nr:glycoside hydrolase family 15 protein [Xanthobacteraceae bacterium]
WLVDVYILQGRIADAERLFRNLIALRNDLGLLSEEYDQQAKRLVGNFPQAFSHMALVNSAYNLTRAEKPVEQRADGRGDAKAKEAKKRNLPPRKAQPRPSNRRTRSVKRPKGG